MGIGKTVGVFAAKKLGEHLLEKMKNGDKSDLKDLVKEHGQEEVQGALKDLRGSDDVNRLFQKEDASRVDDFIENRRATLFNDSEVVRMRDELDRELQSRTKGTPDDDPKTGAGLGDSLAASPMVRQATTESLEDTPGALAKSATNDLASPPSEQGDALHGSSEHMVDSVTPSNGLSEQVPGLAGSPDAVSQARSLMMGGGAVNPAEVLDTVALRNDSDATLDAETLEERKRNKMGFDMTGPS